MKKLASINDLKLELWLRQRNSSFICYNIECLGLTPIKEIETPALINIIEKIKQEKHISETDTMFFPG